MLAKGVLAGSLFLVLGWGLLQTPEAGIWLFPEKFWERQVRTYVGRLFVTQMYLEEDRARLEALKKAGERGFPDLPGSSMPTRQGLSQALARTRAKLQSRGERQLLLQLMLQRCQNQRRTFAKTSKFN